MSRRNRVHVIERAPGALGTIGSSPWSGKGWSGAAPQAPSKEMQDEVRYTRDDFEYFRLKPAKNWRIRPPHIGEKLLMNAKISPDYGQVLVLRPRVVSQNDSNFVFFKVNITTGPHNDVADPWVYIHHAAIRTSVLWKCFQSANVENGYGDLIDVLEKEALDRADEFEDWCIADIERTARLGWSLYSEAPLMKKFGGELRNTFSKTSFDEIKQRLIAANVDAEDPALLDRAIPLLAGWKILNFWNAYSKLTLEPDAGLLGLDSFADTPISLPCSSVLVDSNSGPDDSAHGFLFTKFCDPHGNTIFQVGELGIDGRVAFVEFRIFETTTWAEIADLAKDGEVCCARILRVLSYYALNSDPSRGRRIGLEILPKNHPLAPKEIVMTAPAALQKPPVQATPTRTPISDILARIEAAYEERQRLHYARIAEIRQALDTYADAAKNDLTVDFAKRNGVEDAGELQAPDAALHLADLVDRLPEMGGWKGNTQPAPTHTPYSPPASTRQLAVEAGEDVQTNETDLKRILAKFVDHGMRIVFIGGKKVPAKMPWLTSLLGYEPEWICTEDEAGSKESQSLATRMGLGSVAGVVFFQSFMSHKQTDPLLEAGRESGVPTIAGGRAGKGEITRALLTIEKELS